MSRNSGLQVRAGVRDVAKATEYLQTATSYGLLPSDASKRVQLVQVDITDPDSIAPAIGSASKVGNMDTLWANELCEWQRNQGHYLRHKDWDQLTSNTGSNSYTGPEPLQF